MKKSLIRQLMTLCYLACLLIVLLLAFVIDSATLLVPILLIICPFIGLVLYTVYYIKKKILSPLDDLTRQAAQISKGDLTKPIQVATTDEIGQFMTAFEQMRQALLAQQQQQARFEQERKVFVSSISHDLKTPLASISAQVEALQDGLIISADEQKQAYKIIENKVATLADLSAELAASYETPETLSLTLTAVNAYAWSVDFLDDLKTELALQSAAIQLVNQLPDDGETLLMDGYQLDRALHNLLSNALRYHKQFIYISTAIIDEQFVITFKNDGATVETTDLERLFDRFYTEDKNNADGHLGLGLSVAKTIIEAMNGQIVVEKHQDVIEFTLFLPIH
ncbi:hypothetical protein BAU15_06605 [Enterococcus sp. JM4C]|uniref:HAMP domain-containing sensor histidine kinase n=1 Tax=Candidatus Enterococcus huntleyi TaxID=1857217 RepID=UPI00137B58BD|nr:HAMP domain-containing sensor histidine kinase [Enterococcus sp. JM4C]KAF1297214.1 hypothetical protein BAU15_06605 [Enterococcus sp. JM4C]